MIKSIDQLLTNSKLKKLIPKAQRLAKIDQQLWSVIEPCLRPHCRTISYTNGCLTIVTDSGVWATKIRYTEPELLAALEQFPNLKTINKIHCKVKPNTIHNSEKKRTHLTMSAQNAQLIKCTAEQTSDPKLKNALLRLAKK